MFKAKNENVHVIEQKSEGEISSSITKNWTDQAIRCYKSNFNCMECHIAQGNYSFVCQMPSVVKILLEQIGPPTPEKVEKMLA